MTEPLVPTPARASLLRRLGRFCHRNHWAVLAAWIVGIFVLSGISGAVGSDFSDSFDDFESEATQGFDLLEQGFGGSSGENSGTVVFVADAGVEDPEVRATMEEIFAGIGEIEGLEVTSPYDEGVQGQVAFEGPLAGQLAFATVAFPSNINWSDMVTIADDVEALLPAGAPGDQGDGLRVELGGQPFAEFEPPESEVIGLGFAIVILIAAFGSVLAMGLPIGMALAGIASGAAVIGIVTQFIAMPDFTLTVALMIGLGVGIDYALFIVTRFREDVHNGMEQEAAAGHAIDTAGRAVIFAGITVIISLLGMLTMGLDFIRGIGIGSAIPVAFTLLASITLLPALLGIAGDRLEVTRRRGIIAAGVVALSLVGLGLGLDAAAVGIPVAIVVVLIGLVVPWLKQPLPPRRQKPPRETVWYRYSRLVQRRPWPAAIGGFLVLLVLALPVLGIRLGFSDEGNFPEDTTTRQAYDLLSEGFGPGFNGPLFLVTEVPEGTDPDDLLAVTEAVQADPGVQFVAGPVLSEDEQFARWFTMPTTGPHCATTCSTRWPTRPASTSSCPASPPSASTSPSTWAAATRTSSAPSSACRSCC
jgi:RND superfamily putative drug exporter